MYNPKYEAIMYIENDEFGEWMQKLYAKVQLQKFILPFTANIIFFSNHITSVIIQIDGLITIGKLLKSDSYRFFQFDLLFLLRHTYVFILLPMANIDIIFVTQ